MLFFFLYLALALVLAWVGSKMATARGRDPVIWAIMCFLFGLLGILVLAIVGEASGLKANPRLPMDQKRKWLALVDLDPEIRDVAARARAHGEKYELMLAERYLALGDKSYLKAAEDFVAKQIEADAIKPAPQPYKPRRKP
jgi:hypothetical protein